MKRSGKFRNIAASVCMAVLSGMAYADTGVTYADNGALNLSLPANGNFYTGNFQPKEFQPEKFKSAKFQPYLLAANEGGTIQEPAPLTPAHPAEFQTPWLTGNKLHQYLGLGTLALVGLTAISAPDNEGNTTPPTTGTHQSLGRATAAMAAATVVSGLVMHWDDIYWEDSFFDPDKMHARLGALGALAMLYAVSIAPNSGHSSAGIAGGIAMGVAIKLTW